MNSDDVVADCVVVLEASSSELVVLSASSLASVDVLVCDDVLASDVLVVSDDVDSALEVSMLDTVLLAVSIDIAVDVLLSLVAIWFCTGQVSIPVLGYASHGGSSTPKDRYVARMS